MQVKLSKHIDEVLTGKERKRRCHNRYSGIFSHGLEFMHGESVRFGKGERDDADQRYSENNRSFRVFSVDYFVREAVQERRDHSKYE